MMNIGLAQLNSIPGDFAGNRERILSAYNALSAQGADLVVTPELSLTGGPLLDLLFKADFAPRAAAALAALHEHVGTTPLIVGTVTPAPASTRRYQNVAAVLQKGAPIRFVAKQILSDADVSDESRYFQPAPADSSPIVEIGSKRIAITLGESLWQASTQPGKQSTSDLHLNLSASPFIHGRPEERFHALHRHATRAAAPLLSCHSIGGNDSLIFDGTSLAFNGHGELLAQLPSFAEAHQLVALGAGQPRPFQPMEKLDALLEALTLGLRDYIGKSGFRSVILGLSGGIDSALVAALAVRALGAENVTGITMPSHYSSAGSIDDSLALAQNLGIRCIEIPITPAYDAMSAMLAPHLDRDGTDTTDENLQPRLRALTLMAFSNKFGHLLLSTGNKSEIAVGYCTLYGDMAGGLAPLSDLWKTEVYALSHHLNREREIIPRSTLEKAPSAELRPGQLDQDTLPPYEILDAILSLSIEDDLPAETIIARGYDAETVHTTLRRVALNEYKRSQATLGLKVSKRAFGIGRRLPLVERYRD